ncbi:MAG TPA: molybdopterin-dependent oxidoreductase, partial [Steroidobacteraceae bacterium]
MLTKRSNPPAPTESHAADTQGHLSTGLDRRTFLSRSGLIAGSLATLGIGQVGSIRKANAGVPPPAGAAVSIRKNLCTHCSVGCSVIAEVTNGVWTGQEPVYDSPINRGSHCCKGAAVRDDVTGDRRLRYPMKLVDGQWNRISWDQAINEIGDKLLDIRQKSGPDSVYWLGSAKFTNEAA